MIESLFYFLIFLILSIACFTLPGAYLLQKTKATFPLVEKIILGTIIGFVVFTLLSYILLLLKITVLILPIIFLVDVFFVKSFFGSKINFSLPSRKKLVILSIVFLLGITGQMAVIAPSGAKVNGDLLFWSANGHDGLWHIALMEEIKKGYPLQNPIFAGEKLVNYHFFSDIAPAMFSKYFKLPNLDLYFRFFPFLQSILLGSIAFIVGRHLGKSFTSGVWSTFFVYFAGSFGYIVTWMNNHTIGGESIFWATQIQSSIGNPPQIISNILIFTFLYLFIIFLSKKNLFLFGLCTILLCSLMVFKIYAAIVVLGSLAVVGLIQLVKEKKLHILSLFVLSSVLGAGLYLPNSANSASFLIWEPWWFIRTMVVADSRLNWLDLELKRQTYFAEGNWKRVIQIELTSFLIFFFGNLGTRFLGFLSLLKLAKSILNNYLNQLLILVVLISLILPLLFLQKGVASNTIQFLQYFLLIFGLLAGISSAQILSKIKFKLLKVSFAILIISCSIPTQLGLLYDFYHKPPVAKITSEEIAALNFLEKNTDKNSIILTPPFNKYLNLSLSTPPIWAWFDTSYVSALSKRRTYFADFEQVDIMGYNHKSRIEVEKKVFTEIDNPQELELAINGLNINYMYFPKKLMSKVDLSKTSFIKIFDNNEVEIWKVN